MTSTYPELFDNGPDIHAKMLELVESAEDYLLLNSFLISRDPPAAPITRALKQKHEAGVRIYVLTDSSSRFMSGGKAAFRFLKKAEIPVAEYNPMRVYKLPVAPIMLPRDHRKFWIVDGKVLFLGGANLFPTSLRGPEQGGNIDLMAAVESAGAVAWMIDSFLATWNKTSNLILNREDFPVRADEQKARTTLWVADQNKDAGHHEVVGRMFEELFALARKEVWLVHPYTFVTQGILGQIEELTGRGVQVHVMLSEHVQSPRFRFASFYGIKDLLEVGGKVWLYEHEKAKLHTKATVIDRQWVSVGSANLNLRSLEFSKEANLIFGDPHSVQKITRIVDELRKSCRPVLLDEAEGYRGPEYYLAWLLMQVTG